MPAKHLNKDLFCAVPQDKEKIILNRLFGKILASRDFQIENAVARCGCYLCQARNLTGESDAPIIPGRGLNDQDNKITNRGSGPSQYLGGLGNATTLDSLSAINSPYIDGLLLGGKWGDFDPDNKQTTSLNYYYYTNGEISYLQQYTDNKQSNDWVAAEKLIIEQSMNDYENVANITFTLTESKENAHIRWSSYEDTPGAFGAAFGPTFAGPEPGDIQVNSAGYFDDLANGSINPGSFYYITFTHELGHAIGLKHPHNAESLASIDYPLFPGVSENGTSDRGDNGLNSTPWTVMTYNDQPSNETSTNTVGNEVNLSPKNYGYTGYLTNLGAFDIAAAHYLYGPNESANIGDNTYELISSMNGFTTIWDNGGEDTISAVNATQPSVIDLRSATLVNEAGGGGFLSRHGDDFKGYTIAYNTTGTAIIENAIGSSLADRITGNEVANTLNGGAGDDTMAGGAGDDTYVVDSISDVVTENASKGTDLIQASVSFTASPNVENLTLTGSSDLNATGNTHNNTLTGNSGANSIDGAAGDDTLDGSTGDDTMAGGAGDDTYVVDSISDVVTENASEGTDLIQASVSFTASSNVENLALTGSSDLNATGNSDNNILTGNSGANILDGSTGDDTMAGGAGDDTYVVDSISDVVTENASEGTDLIQASVSFTASSNVENLTLTGSSDLNATGNTENNTLTGNSGANILDGSTGDDTMAGGAGDDSYVVDSISDVVTENASEGTDLIQASVSFTASPNVENLTLTGSSDLNATGNTQNNTLTGNSGANILDGSTGDDTMAGGAGDDTYVVDSISDVVTENASEGTDLIQASVSFTASPNVENLTLTGSSDLNATGNTQNNTLTGNSGANILDGSTGDDTMAGGAGDDTYVVDSISDVVTENASEGTDLIQASVSFTASPNVENLALTGSSDLNATGNTQNNTLTGNSGANILDGSTGDDTMAGGAGDDTYVVDSISDVVTENASEGTDLIQASVSFTASPNVENLTLTGSSDLNATGNTQNNTLTGNSGANILDGSTGDDTMAGGAGDDTYVVDSISDVVTENASEGTDLIQASVSFTASPNVENLHPHRVL